MSTTDRIFLARPDKVDGGIPLAVKDLFDTAGLTTTYGSLIFIDHVPTSTAEAVRRLEAAGYENIGKTNLHEFAYGVTSMNPHFGWVPNPHAPGRIAGGSSGGSAAAVAAGLANAAVGTDSGGSIRIPAAFCGIVGFKPTFGRVPLEGCWSLAPSYDHAGPMGRDVRTCAAMMQALVDRFDRLVVELDDLSVALAWTDYAQPGVGARVEDAAALFPHLARIDFPQPDGTDYVFMREVAEVHATLFKEQEDAYSEDVARKIRKCLEVTDAEVAKAKRRRNSYRESATAALEGYDLLLTPAQGLVAPTYEEAADEAPREYILRFTFAFNVLGWPALALPCGLAEEGLPASIQIIGRPGADALVLAAAERLERALSAGDVRDSSSRVEDSVRANLRARMRLVRSDLTEGARE